MSEETEENEKKKSDNRWWEFYFVRYFVGTAIGAIIVLFLSTANNPLLGNQGEVASILQTMKPDKFESGYVAVLATVGLAFCYIASAPILVFHATRGSLLALRENKLKKPLRWSVFIVFVLTGALGFKLWRSLDYKGCPFWQSDFYAGIAFLLLTSVIFVSQMFLLWLSMLSGEQKSFEYYDQLVRKRSAADGAGKEYMESYRHLREHGNAFFIALLEFLLGATLYFSPVPWAMVFMLWIFPAVGVWFFGNYLENRNF